jgi:hypothetical protein
LPSSNSLRYNSLDGKRIHYRKVVAQGGLNLASSSKNGYTEMRVFLRTGPATALECLHIAFANLRDEPEAIAAFAKKYGPIVVPGLGDEHGPHEAHDLKVARAYRNGLRAAWAGDKEAVAGIQRAVKHLLATISVTGTRIEIEPRESWVAAYLLFLQDQSEGKPGICANPECAAPYFIRKRNTQKFCEAGPCVAYGARLRANKWWHEHGDDWRESNQKSTKGRKQ